MSMRDMPTCSGVALASASTPLTYSPLSHTGVWGRTDKG